MDAFERRKLELIDECQVAPEVMDEVLPRLNRFMEPFVASFVRREQVGHASTFVQGLLSDLDRKNVESIAYRYDQDRLPLQSFIGISQWDDKPLRTELARQVGQNLGRPDGVIVFDPSGFPKSGKKSVGVARQWCGRLGKVDNCQVAVYLAYVSQEEHALVDGRLFLPEEWTKDKARCREAGVPKDRQRHRTRHELCLEMLEEHGRQLPHEWIAGDDEMGRPYHFRRSLHEAKERYLLAVPSNTLIRDLETDEPPYSGTGRPSGRPWQRVDKWAASLPDSAWTKIEVRDGSKGPLTVRIVKRCVAARAPQGREGHPEVLVVTRSRERDGVAKVDYYLSNAAPDTELSEFARVAKAEHRVEECLQRGKSEAGLGDYEVRNWRGWHHHQTLSLIASWFLVTELQRGKKMDPGHHAATTPGRHRANPARRQRLRNEAASSQRTAAATCPQRARAALPLETP